MAQVANQRLSIPVEVGNTRVRQERDPPTSDTIAIMQYFTPHSLRHNKLSQINPLYSHLPFTEQRQNSHLNLFTSCSSRGIKSPPLLSDPLFQLPRVLSPPVRLSREDNLFFSNAVKNYQKPVEPRQHTHIHISSRDIRRAQQRQHSPSPSDSSDSSGEPTSSGQSDMTDASSSYTSGSDFSPGSYSFSDNDSSSSNSSHSRNYRKISKHHHTRVMMKIMEKVGPDLLNKKVRVRMHTSRRRRNEELDNQSESSAVREEKMQPEPTQTRSIPPRYPQPLMSPPDVSREVTLSRPQPMQSVPDRMQEVKPPRSPPELHYLPSPSTSPVGIPTPAQNQQFSTHLPTSLTPSSIHTTQPSPPLKHTPTHLYLPSSSTASQSSIPTIPPLQPLTASPIPVTSPGTVNSSPTVKTGTPSGIMPLPLFPSSGKPVIHQSAAQNDYNVHLKLNVKPAQISPAVLTNLLPVVDKHSKGEKKKK
ncbi:hypothetical protein BLNAU_2155 [Blattamonas nauphoetae]|uniref:Uncharacterized protein n=1 Tax=Blattamonas nauphoetae TaxID=2049346 RepID=A0ABQ9YG52_9EUKA|nr:hypothetical protein BLNAU_2155 [Blattamonas nauphoetae]